MSLDEPSQVLLRVQGITKRFGATVALDGADLEVRAGEVHGLIGENGAGKSTLTKILAGALAPDEGRMTLEGQPFAPRSPSESRAAGIAVIHQELSLAPHLTVAENVVLGVEPRRWAFLDRAGARRIAREALSAIGAEGLPVDRMVRELAPGQRQLVEIARAHASGARLLVFDEPTTSLSQGEAERLFALVERLRSEGRSVIYVSHALEEVERLADRVTVLRDGRVAAEVDVADFDLDRAVAHMVGREVRELYPRSRREPGEVILTARGIAGRPPLVDATLELHRGEVLGLAGLVGAGRTEFLRALFGLDVVKRGTLRLGVIHGACTPHERWRTGTGFVSEDRASEGLALELSLAENLCLPRLERSRRFGFLFPGAASRAAAPWIERLGIKTRGPAEQIARLSGGNQQKVALARLFLAKVDVLLLDEPTRGIDVAARAEIYGWIDELARSGKAILIASSSLPELLGICDRIAVMARGRLGAARPTREWTEHAILREAAGLVNEG